MCPILTPEYCTFLDLTTVFVAYYIALQYFLFLLKPFNIILLPQFDVNEQFIIDFEGVF
jgi:hypothetical protein